LKTGWRAEWFLPICRGRRAGEAPLKKSRAARWMDPNVRAAQLAMERILGMRVRIQGSEMGRGGL